MKRRPSALIVALCCLLAVPLAFAQEQGGSIQGTVKDSTGAVLPGVTVEARQATTGAVATTVTDAQGAYRFPALAPGSYQVDAALDGFAPARVTAVRLALGQLLKVDLTLAVAGVSENINVTGEAPLIDTKQNASFVTVQTDVIDRIPKGRDFTSVILTAPGAQNETKAGGMQVDGASGSENRFVVDGMDTTNLQTGVSGKNMLVDFIQEVQVKSSGYNAEFGGATGGVISAITKSGTNALHGSAGLYFQNDKMLGPVRATNQPYQPVNNNLAYNPWQSNLAMFDTRPVRAPFTYTQPVADLGGPVMKDRLWFYAGGAFLDNPVKQDAVFFADPALETRHFKQSNRSWNANYNLTSQLGNNLRLRVSASNERTKTRGTYPGYQILGDFFNTLEPRGMIYQGPNPALYGKDVGGYTRVAFDADPAAYNRRWVLSGNSTSNDIGAANLDWIVTSTFFLNTTVGYMRTNYWTPPEARGDSLVHVFAQGADNYDGTMIAAGYPTVPAAFQAAAGFADNISSSGYLRNIYDRIYLNTNASWYKTFRGQHLVKAGFRYERFGNDIYNGNIKPQVNFHFGQAFSVSDGRIMTGRYGYYYVNKTGTIGKIHSNNYAFWLQDSYTVGPKLTINAGVRTESEHVPSYKQGADVIDIRFGFRDKIAPRIGFAYDIKGNSKWKVYGSFGYFYDITKLELPRSAFGGDHWINYYWTLDTYDWRSINCDEGSTGCPGTFIESVDLRRSSNQPDSDLAAYFNRPGMTGVDPDLKPVQTGEVTLGGDHEINQTTSFGIRYTHKWLFRTIEDVGLLINGNEVYIIANPGFGYAEVMSMEYPQFKTPKAQRDYDAVEFRLRKRLANRWSAEVTYTLSRLWGNYGGLASSDENGRLSPNVNRYYDAPYMSWDNKQQVVKGLLPTDRPHVFKVQGTYDLPWGTTVGVYGVWQSGQPQSSQVTWKGYPVYFNGRGDLGRMPAYKQLDLNLQHEFKLGGRQRLVVQANALNVFDLKTPTAYSSTSLNRDRITTSSEAEFFAAPWDPVAVMAAKRAAGATMRDQQFYKKLDQRQAPRNIMVSAKLSF